MLWLRLSAGHALDLSVRVAQFALALDDATVVQVHMLRADAPWQRLLSAQERKRLADATPSSAQKELGLAALMDSAAELLETGEAPPDALLPITRYITCQPSDAVVACSVPNTWLVVTGAGSSNTVPHSALHAAPNPAHLASYAGVLAIDPWAFATPNRPARPQHGPHPQALPVAVDTTTFHPQARPHPPGGLLLMGQGDLPASIALAQAMHALGAPAITLFDPYLDYTPDLPQGLQHVGISTPAIRARAFATCSAALVVDPHNACDNHFLWEAVACGAAPLGAFAPSPGLWQPETFAAAWAAYRSGHAPAWRVTPVPWAHVAAEVLRALAGAPEPHVKTPGKSRSAPPLPTLVVTHGGERSDFLSEPHLGIRVATRRIVDGLVAGSPGRVALQWLGYQDPDGTRGRFYNYPVGAVETRSPSEFDFAQLPERMAAGSIDAVCSCDPVADDMLAARQLWSPKAVPVVTMLHALNGHGMPFHLLLQALQFEMFDFDAVISPTACGAAAYAQMHGSAIAYLREHTRLPLLTEPRVEVIPYGIDRAPFVGLHKAACRHALRLPHNKVVLLSVGRFSQRDKADLLPLLLAVHQLRQAQHPVLLVLAGGIACPDYIKQMQDTIASLGLRDAVRTLGAVDGVNKTLLYGAADAFVSVSDNVQETFGLAILEAMAARLPVVASAWNGAKEIVREGDTGFLVPTAWQPPELASDQVARLGAGVMGESNRDLHERVVVDVACLIARLKTLVTDAALRQRMGQRGLEACAQDYDAPTQGRRMVGFVETLIVTAKRHAWHPDRTRGPFMSATAQRFAHYPSDVLDDAQRLQLAPWAVDPALCATILHSTEDVGCPQEQQLARAILALVQRTPGVPLGDISQALAQPPWSEAQVRARVVRCLKYGLLQVFLGTCS